MSEKINTYGMFFKANPNEVSNPGDDYDFYSNAHIGINEKGNRVVISDGKINIREMIQKSKPDTIAELLLKYTQTGDSSYLNKQGNLGYLDVTQLPQTREELLDLPIKLRKVYDELDPTIKDKFNGYDTFANSILDGSIASILAVQEEVKEEKKEEVKENA